jgi:energy-coupling factor transporter transmembrane protein EcfT
MQIILFLLFILAIVSIFVIKKDELSTGAKVGIIVIFVFLIALASWFEFSQDSQAQVTREKVNAFLQGKILDCGGIKVSKKGFDYVSGTQTFVPFRENVKYKGIVLEASKCKVIN